MTDMTSVLSQCLTRGIPIDPMPEMPPKSRDVPHAPIRVPNLNEQDTKLALRNALRYFPSHLHAVLAPEFAEELRTEGHIYMRRFRPTEYEMQAYPITSYPGKCEQAKCMMLMIMNNLDKRVAQFPEELITYGGNGSVLSNWAQYHLLMKYLSELTEEQTLVMSSGHPAGLFPSTPSAPRAVITNGLMVPHYSTHALYDKGYAQGVTQYGQMTAGSWCYIGPQGIVHGTTLVIMNAGRRYLAPPGTVAPTGDDSTAIDTNLKGKVYLSSGLGGMSGAQGKAGMIAGCVTVLAEVDAVALDKRLEQGWVSEKVTDLDALVSRVRAAKADCETTAIAYLGNIVDVWEKFAEIASTTGELLVDISSDQTSLHNPYNGGYYPAGISFDESQSMMHENPAKFKDLVQESLRRQISAINTCVSHGAKFWDYGNCFLLEAFRAGGEVVDHENMFGEVPTDATVRFRYPSYVEEFMGDIFSLGFGPFRWVCTSGLASDLEATDRIAAKILEDIKNGRAVPGLVQLEEPVPGPIQGQLSDNITWIEGAMQNKLVVGSQARILYADAQGRCALAAAFNDAIRDGIVSQPIVLSRDHHDVSGTDSPFRETSSVRDGSQLTADMATHCFVGNCSRGATWASLHNGGGTGWGEAVNGGFGLVLDGSEDAFQKSQNMLFWDVNGGVTRRAWAGNNNAKIALGRAQRSNNLLQVTEGVHITDDELDKLLAVSPQ